MLYSIMPFTEQTNDKGATIVLDGDIDLEKTEELRDQAMQSLDNNHELELQQEAKEALLLKVTALETQL